MKRYCGIDLHADNSAISVIDEKDAIVCERRYPNDLSAILGALEPFQDALLACVVESTYNWYWLVDGLMDAGFDVRLTHTGAIPQYAGIKHSNDQTDARHLAHLLRLGILPEGHIQLREQRASPRPFNRRTGAKLSHFHILAASTIVTDDRWRSRNFRESLRIRLD